MNIKLFTGKRILITGGTGTIASNILRTLIKTNPTLIRIFSRDEMKQYTLQSELCDYKNIEYIIGDVRNKQSIYNACKDIDIVFHTAALKQVPVCEHQPDEAFLTNVIGTMNTANAAVEAGVDKLVNISTDKAVHPTSVLGSTKLIGERLIETINNTSKNTILYNVRFGNVIDSRGSLIPKILEQISKGGPVTITDPRMTRFLMHIHEATNLIFQTFSIALGGETFVLKMKSFKVSDLLEVLIETKSNQKGINPNDIETKIIGIRPGEKLHEELLTYEENERALETPNLIIIPQTNQTSTTLNYPEAKYPLTYNVIKSDCGSYMSKSQIKKLIFVNNDENEHIDIF